MPHQINTEDTNSTSPADAAAAATTTTTSAATGLPSSLLWAHQLRREHKALVSRTDQLEGKLSSSKEGAETGFTSITMRLDDLEGKVRGLRDEIGDLQSVSEALGRWKEETDRARKEVEERERDKMADWEEKVKGEIRDEIRSLDEMVKGLREKVDKGVSGLPEAREDYGIPPSAQPGKRDTRIPSTVSGTTNSNHDMRRSSPFVTESCPPQSSRPSSRAREHDASPILGSSPPPPPPPGAIGNGPQALLGTLNQGTRSLSCYLELGESVLAKFPRRRDEAKVVESFWEGLAAGRIKNLVEERLEEDGWAWNVLREAIKRHIIPEVTKQKVSRQQDETAARRKKRRVIPLVWSEEDEGEDWLNNFKRK